MRTIIAGAADVRDGLTIDWIISLAGDAGIVPTVILCGETTGVDAIARRWGERHAIPCERYSLDRGDKAAGLIAITYFGGDDAVQDVLRYATVNGVKTYVVGYIEAIHSWNRLPASDRLEFLRTNSIDHRDPLDVVAGELPFPRPLNPHPLPSRSQNLFFST